MNAEDINVGDEVRVSSMDAWITVKHIEGDLIVGRHPTGSPVAYMAQYVAEVRRPKKPLGYEPVEHARIYAKNSADPALNEATHVVTHWSDGTCTIDTIAAFREAHQ